VFLGLMLWLLSGVLLPFVAAFVLGYLLDPIVNGLERIGVRRLGATLLVMVWFTLTLALISILLLPILWRQVENFVAALPGYAITLEGLLSDEIKRLSRNYGGDFLNKLGLGEDGATIVGATTDLLGQAAQWGVLFLKSVVTQGAALLDTISLLVVTPVVAFYMLLDWNKMIATIDGLVPVRHRATVRRLAFEINTAMAGFLRGQSLVCLFLGAWYGIGLSLIGLNFGLLIGILAGVLSFIPFVGSITALILSSAIAIVQAWPQWNLPALSLTVVFAGQFLEGNILAPKLVGESVGLHPVWLIFALLAFGSLFGITGLIAAVPNSAAAGVILRFAIARFRESDFYKGKLGTRPE
jgi:predicted PurR-regulated permease PerM